MSSGATAHYIQDATQPLHASVNYDGVATDQRGVHTRFEAVLIERFESRLTITPGPLKAVTSPKDLAFDTLLASFQKVDALLKADKDAIGAKDTYDDAYFEAFFARVKPIVDAQLSIAVNLTASLITSAWEQAGKPNLYPKVTPHREGSTVALMTLRRLADRPSAGPRATALPASPV